MEAVPPQKTAQEYLPEEMWNKIFGYLDKEKDVMSCYLACTHFQNLLKPKIFAQALTLVQRQVSQTTSPLEEKDILSCRLVSRDWRKMTNHFLQSRSSRLDLSCYRFKPSGFYHSFPDQRFNAPNQFGAISLQMDKLEEAHALVDQIIGNVRTMKEVNVLCGRHLIIVGYRGTYRNCEDTRNPDKLRFYDLVSRLLTACGKHLWCLTIADAISDGLPQWLFNTFWKWLRLLPNLKMLTCQISTGLMTHEKHLELKAGLETGISQQPFPHLPKLVTFQSNGIPDIVLQSALEVNPHIQKLDVYPFQHRADVPLNIHQWQIRTLTEFCFIVTKTEDMKQLTETGWPLEKLTMRFAYIFSPLLAGIEDRLVLLASFGKTLKYLRTDLPFKIPLAPEEPQWELQLPHLEELHLDVLNHTRVDFIRPLVSLKKLKLSAVYYDAGMEPHLLFQNKATPMYDLYESKIWEGMPSLKEVVVVLFQCLTKSFIRLKFTRGERFRKLLQIAGADNSTGGALSQTEDGK